MPEMMLMYAKSYMRDAQAAEARGDAEEAESKWDAANLHAFGSLKTVIEMRGGMAGPNPDVLCDPLVTVVATATGLSRYRAMPPGMFLRYAERDWPEVATRPWFMELREELLAKEVK